MSKTLDTLDRLRQFRRGADAVERGAKQTAAVAGEAYDTGKKVVDTVKEPLGKAHRYALTTRPGKVADRLVDGIAGKKKGARASAAYGAFTPVAGLGAKKGTEVAATAASHAGGLAGKLTGIAIAGPAGAVPGMLIGGGVGGALSQSATIRKAVRATKAVAKSGVRKTVKKYNETKSDVAAGGNMALGSAVTGDLKALAGRKRGSRYKAFRRGMKLNKMHREIKEDLGTLKSLSRRGRIKPAK